MKRRITVRESMSIEDIARELRLPIGNYLAFAVKKGISIIEEQVVAGKIMGTLTERKGLPRSATREVTRRAIDEIPEGVYSVTGKERSYKLEREE